MKRRVLRENPGVDGGGGRGIQLSQTWRSMEAQFLTSFRSPTSCLVCEALGAIYRATNRGVNKGTNK